MLMMVVVLIPVLVVETIMVVMDDVVLNSGQVLGNVS